MAKHKPRKKKSATKYESEIETHLVRYAILNGCIAEKLVFKDKRGFPDRTVITRRGVVGFVEIKRPGGELSRQQRETIAELRELKLVVAVVETKQEAERFVELLLRKKLVNR